VTRVGDLWPAVVSWPNLVRAAAKARRGKRARDAVLRFDFDLERQLLRLQRDLISGEYRPGPFTTHWIHHPKPRLISAAPYRDRVVHHALMNVLEPILDRRFHPDSYACRVGKGTHAAARRLQRLMRRYRYTLQCDVRKFFPSIDHAILKGQFRRVVKDRRLLALMDLVVDSSNEQEPVASWFPGDDLFTPATRRKGLPIGNLTSQWFANWYLDGLDHLVTSHLRVGGHVRYCDDFVLLDNDRGRLREIVAATRDWLASRRLKLHEERLCVLPSRTGRVFVGMRTWPTHRVVRAANVRAFRRRVGWMRRAYADGRIHTREQVRCRFVSWLGYASQASSQRLLTRLSRNWIFRRRPCAPAPR